MSTAPQLRAMKKCLEGELRKAEKAGFPDVVHRCEGAIMAIDNCLDWRKLITVWEDPQERGPHA